VYFVDSGSGVANNGNDGLHPINSPLATIAGGVSKCTSDNGDFIVAMPGHAEAPTAVTTINKSDVTIVGVGNGKNRPKFTHGGATDCLDITADDVTIDNFYFAVPSAAATADINCGAANYTIKNCYFEHGAQPAAAASIITIPAAGINGLILNNEFHVTANVPDVCIRIEGATTYGTKIIGNYFNGQNDTNAWDTGVIYCVSASLNLLIKDNIFCFGANQIELTAACTGMIIGNFVGEGTLGGMIDPGSCMCFDNREADAVDQSGRLFPATTAS
jgi:hypothetical protein